MYGKSMYIASLKNIKINTKFIKHDVLQTHGGIGDTRDARDATLAAPPISNQGG